ncbi:hypothetical protein ColKHC_14245 [Colletotrichum higginsianum]|nr:hypothetical protein ColKHC_14245 [Colletotrichum higginsianum]
MYPAGQQGRQRQPDRSIVHHALRSLEPNQWLNDDVVNFFMGKLVARDATCAMIASTVVHAVAESPQPPRWVGAVARKMEAVQRCFVPVCHDCHWVLFLRASGVNPRMSDYFHRFLRAVFPDRAPVSLVGVSSPASTALRLYYRALFKQES